MKAVFFFSTLGGAVALACLMACQPAPSEQAEASEEAAAKRIPVLLDTDANNELDDQHAIAYMLFNGDVFDVRGITTNRTYNGGGIAEHTREAERVVALCGLEGDIPVYPGADKNFDEIEPTEEGFDGQTAVDVIIEQAKALDDTLVLVPIGKLTNIALALKKAPEIAREVRIVWLGSNYPEPGEYNQNNDTAALNYLLDLEVPFEIVTVRYGKPSGSDAVRVTPEEALERMGGRGPTVATPVEGRHGGSFTTFGDYAVDLFSNIDLHGDPPSRALFDVVALAIIKDPSLGEVRELPAPHLVKDEWQERPDNPRTIKLWENFDERGVLDDFYGSMEAYELAKGIPQ